MILASTPKNNLNLFSWDFGFTELKVILNIFLTIIVVSLICYFYYRAIKKRKANEVPKNGFTLIFDIFILNIENLVKKTIGNKYLKLVPYFLMIFFYINVSNFISIFLDLDTPFTFLPLVLFLGFITFLGIYFFGFTFQKLKYFKTVLNPIELSSKLASFISISFRLFGNLLAGFFIMFLLYNALDSVAGLIDDQFRYFNILAIFASPLHIYFDFFSGPLHSFIFVTLTLTYWASAKPLKQNSS